MSSLAGDSRRHIFSWRGSYHWYNLNFLTTSFVYIIYFTLIEVIDNHKGTIKCIKYIKGGTSSFLFILRSLLIQLDSVDIIL